MNHTHYKLHAQVAKAIHIAAEVEDAMRKVGILMNDPDTVKSVVSRDDSAFWAQAAKEAGVNPPSLETVDIAITVLVTNARVRSGKSTSMFSRDEV